MRFSYRVRSYAQAIHVIHIFMILIFIVSWGVDDVWIGEWMIYRRKPTFCGKARIADDLSERAYVQLQGQSR